METTIHFEEHGDNKKSILINFQKPQVEEDQIKETVNNENISFIQDFVSKINALNNNIILDYDYKINQTGSDTEIELFILWKHLFSKFGEKQQYLYIKCYVIKEKNKILFHSLDTTKLPTSVPKGAIPMNIKNGSITNNVNGECVTIAIKYTTNMVSAQQQKNEVMIKNFISSSFLSTIGELKKCFSVQNGVISWSF